LSDKTEKPTAKRLAKARSEGDSAVSAPLSQSVGFVAALAVVNGVVAVATERAAALISAALARPSALASPATLATIVLGLTVPVVAVAAVAGAALSLAQTGGALSMKKLSPSFDRLNVFTGLKGLFSWQRVVSIARALVAAALVGWYAVRQLATHGADFGAAVGNARAAAVLAASLALHVAWFAAAVGLSLGLVDLLLTRRAWFNRHRMTKDEIKR